jgi:hypothetical protein
MKSAIIAPNEGFDILVNGLPRTFRDAKLVISVSARG